MDNYKAEIMQTEKDFAIMAKEEGLQAAFLFYAAEDAVINRNDSVLKGKEAIRVYYEKQSLKDVQLDWKPDYIEVSLSGDLAYTYGKYTFSAMDEQGEIIKSEGIFHTVWKRQADGSWKFVWD